jgi:hypothetical protein
MSESGRAPGGDLRANRSKSQSDSPVARRVHVLLAVLPGAALSACVVPPPLEVETQDAGVNSPPIIQDLRDAVGTPYRPPATLTVNLQTQPPAEISLTLFDLDVQDELTVQMFVDYDVNPLDARVSCTSPGSIEGSTSRTLRCTTSGLCTADDALTTDPHRLEIEVYDGRPEDMPPYRTPPEGALFSTWTLDLVCIDVAP